jgi:hypothetical protein
LSLECLSNLQQPTCLVKRCHGNACSLNCCPATVYSALPRECVCLLCSSHALASRCPAMDVHSNFTISAFSRHVIIHFSVKWHTFKHLMLHFRSWTNVSSRYTYKNCEAISLVFI